MRLLKPRPAAVAAPVSSTAHYGTVDPPIVAALVKPLLQLRSALGSGRPVPDPVITTALTSATSANADAESSHRDGVYTLESSWDGPAAQAAVPALRTTQTQLGDITDRGPAYLGVLADAQDTSARAAAQVDRIIANFRSDAKTILAGATAAPDTDALINRAAQALRDAINVVSTAQTEMAGHTQRLDDIGPMTVVQGVSAPYGGTTENQYVGTDPAATTTTGVDSSGPDPSGTVDTTPAVDPSAGVNSTGTAAPAPSDQVLPAGVPTTGVTDPAQVAQLQLQQQLVSAGVQLGTAAISAGVDIGTHLIDKIADLGTHLIDAVANEAETVVPELLHLPPPSGTTSTDANGNPYGSDTGTDQSGVAIPAAQNGTGTLFPGLSTPTGSTPTGAWPTGAAPAVTAPAPVPSLGAPAPSDPVTAGPNLGGTTAPLPAAPNSTGAPGYSVLPPDTSTPSGPDPSSGAPATGTTPTPAPQDSGPVGGMALPASPAPTTVAPKPDPGQLGVTEPAALELVPAAVIGEFGDDGL